MPVTKTIRILLSNGKTLIVGKSFVGSQYQKSQYPNVVKRGKEYVQEVIHLTSL